MADGLNRGFSTTPFVDRRQFLGASLATAASVGLSGKLASAADTASTASPEICVFTKFVQSMSFDDMAEAIAEIGLDGVEAPVRNKGYVLPERVEDDLPKHQEAVKKHGLKTTMITTDVLGLDQPHTEKVLRTAAGLGIKLAAPDRPVVSLMGDGGFGMTVSELSTAVDHGINTVTLVMNNRCWGAEKAYQRDFFGERYIGADISSPPFDKLAELYGAKGYKAKTLDETAQAIEDALVCGKPSVIDVSMDPAALYSFRRDSFRHRGG